MSQENVSDKVRNLQRQIAQGIKFGQRPPSLRRSEGDEGSSDEEEVPRSPLKVLAQVEAEPPKTEPKGAQSSGPHSPPVKSPKSKRVLPPTGTIESINLDAVPQSVPRLDNTAAKHKLSVKPKNQRISRKHRRFTQDLQEVSIPGVVQEDLEAAGISTVDHRRASVEESLESFKKQRLHEEERQEARRRRDLEEQRIRQEEEERRRRAEELRLRELEEERCRKLQQEEEERMKREEEERKIREEEERRQREEEERIRRMEEERRMREEEERRQREEEEERRRLEEQRRKEEEERKRREEEERRKKEEEARRQQELEAERKRKLKEEEEERKKKEEAEKLKLRELEEKKKLDAEERIRKEEEEEQRRMSLEEADGSSDPQERKRRAEELRWKEMEERQRPFSFKVSSGEKQILFQKVNLTPVTPASSHQSAAVTDQREGANKTSSSEAPDSPNLPTSPYVPHTAILVTGAQLCGTAVNLDQIKDTACKSLLGLGEDRKAQGTPPTKTKTSPDRKSGKTKSLNESALSTDQSSAAVLAEWASIRSKIFKGVEDGKYEEYPDPSRNQPQPSTEEQPAFAHTNLRKTMSASAKFSITPAKKKFGDSNRNSEVFATPSKRSEECMFAKDLPSFLVPSPGAKPEGAELKSRVHSETEASESREEAEERGQDGEDKPSPFGIKLRRTNYSLRFHSEQSTEKRKKRYSAGDSFDGVPSPLTPIEPDSDASSVFSDKSSPSSPQKEGAVGKYLQASASPRGKLGKSASSTAHSESEKVISKPPVYRRPTTSPKPAGAVPTPPPSPLPKAVHGQSNTPMCMSCPAEKPSLQSRHSLDSAKVQDKEAGPLWITLALQKQKGFREQQQNREERRSQREAKLAEKQLQVTPTPEEPKRPDSLLGRFDRREHLKKANTLPSSVTVEIADSTPSPPAVKEVSKRFPSSDSPQVSTEPAWLALAKRKAKAWSDCPQIIK
uniref:DUF4592 domain-containing protein n=1 Tax=Amphiprion ocellaris TaxID=80972 RepID=A0AAQ5ZF73_AMPOC